MLASFAGGRVGGGQVALVHSFNVVANSNGVSPHHAWLRFAFYEGKTVGGLSFECNVKSHGTRSMKCTSFLP